jgi:hypothetical protein
MDTFFIWLNFARPIWVRKTGMKKGITIFNKQLWHSFLALSGFFFKAFTIDRVSGADFFTEEKFQAFKGRIDRLKDGTPAKWGTMRVDQMLHHVNLSMGSGLGIYNITDESYLFSRTVMKWILIDWYPAQPEGLQLPLGLSISPKARYDFETEKTKLLAMLDVATTTESTNQWKPHCYFGKLSVTQWGKLCTMHLDYHLRQFSA